MAMRMTAVEVLRRYKDEELPEFCDRELSDVNQVGLFGDYPLHVAATRGLVEEVLALLEAGANVDARGEHGYTPLLSAVAQGHVEAARLLLQYGAATDVANDWGDTPLQRARASEIAGLADLLENPPRAD
jgi:uncharacterized protein